MHPFAERRPAALLAALLLAACGHSGPPASGSNGDSGNPGTPPTTAAAACDPERQRMPPAPAPGQSRTGLVCAIHIPSPFNAEEIMAISVMEPTTFTGGEKYPLVLDGHGLGNSRNTTGEDNPLPGRGGPVGLLRRSGYGVASIDQAGHGDSDGTIRLMDPDQEGQLLIAIVDWLEANLDWVQVGPDLDAGRDNILLGATGPSYGGGFQLLLQHIDPKKRLDAIVPQITWHDLNHTLQPGGVVKLLWDAFLFAGTQRAGGGFRFDPFVTQMVRNGFLNNRVDAFGSDFLAYHSSRYFCDGTPVATNGGPGTQPLLPPSPPTAVHALIFQGIRDTLLPFNEGWLNYECLNPRGGDVRLLTYQAGHNSLQVVPDPGALIHQPLGALDFNCGDIDTNAATVAFFDEHLKGIKGAADAVLRGVEVCLSLAPGDAVFTQKVTAGRGGTGFAVPPTTTVAGLNALPVAVPLFTAPEGGAVVGGVPRIEITLTAPAPLVTDPDNVIVFVGTGRTRNSLPGVWELADNQVQPLRGLGPHAVDLPGIGERLAAGEQVGLMLYGLHEQYLLSGGVNLANPVVTPVTMMGEAWLPLLAGPPAAP